MEDHLPARILQLCQPQLPQRFQLQSIHPLLRADDPFTRDETTGHRGNGSGGRIAHLFRQFQILPRVEANQIRRDIHDDRRLFRTECQAHRQGNAFPLDQW